MYESHRASKPVPTRSRAGPGALAVALCAASLLACSDSPGSGGTTEPPPVVTAPPAYRVSPPAGKLPWPQHDPDWDQARYDAMLAGVWVVNNYGLYQGGANPAGLYLHNAFDIGLPNGTLIYAVAPGTVRAQIGGNEFYRTLVVEDEDRPGYAWSYTHIYHFRVVPGQKVHRGTLLGQVNFAGLEHIHLGRVMLRPGGSWTNFDDHVSLQPDTFFVYRDTEAPVFEGRFRYVRNQTDSAFVAAEPDGMATVSGDVDVVVGLRDPGEWARSRMPYGGPTPYGDRNAPNRVEYEIAAPDGTVHRAVAFDLSRTTLPREAGLAAAEQVLTLYQHYESVLPAGPAVGNHNARFNFYVITNSDGTGPAAPRPLDPAARAHAWRTAERDAAGRPRFPNGEYVVTVRAYDFKKNVATRSERVRVRN